MPQFGDWDQKGVMPDYSMDFSKIRENRKQNKSRASLGNEEELISTANSKSNTVHSAHSDDLQFHQTHPSTVSSFGVCCSDSPIMLPHPC